MQTRCRSLVLYDEARLDIGCIAEYNRMYKKALLEKQKHSVLLDSILRTVNIFKDDFEKEFTKIKDLRNEIRLFTVGTPTAYALDSNNSEVFFDMDKHDQFRSAKQVLLKSAYRKLASITHPDNGGDADTFHAVHTAYKERDLNYLNDLYLTLTKRKSLFWQQKEGILDAKTALERPKVAVQALQSNPIFNVARLYVSGNKEQAKQLLFNHLNNTIGALVAELRHLQRKDNGNQETNPEDHIQGS